MTEAEDLIERDVIELANRTVLFVLSAGLMVEAVVREESAAGVEWMGLCNISLRLEGSSDVI